MNGKKILLLITVFYCTAFSSRTFGQQTDEVEKVYARFQLAVDEQELRLLPAIDKACNRLKRKMRLTVRQTATIELIQGGIKYHGSAYDEAQPVLAKALQLCEKVYGKTCTRTLEAKTFLAWNCGYLGRLKMEYGYYDELMQYYKQDRAKYVLELADMYNTIGQSYGYDYSDWVTEQLYFDSARSLLETYKPADKALMRRKLFGQINFYNSIAVSYFQSGNYENAQICARKCLELWHLYAKKRAQEAVSWMIIGRCLYETEENLDSSLYYLSRAIGMLNMNDTRMPWTSYKAYKAGILMKAGLPDKAIAEAESGLGYCKGIGSLNPAFAGNYIRLAGMESAAYLKKADYKKALLVCEDANSRVADIKGLQNTFVITLRTQYATALYANKQWHKAEEAFRSAVALTGTTFEQLSSGNYTIPDIVPYEYLNVFKQTGNYLTERGLALHNGPDVEKGINILKKVADGLERQRAWLFEAGIDDGVGSQDLHVHEDLLEALYRSKGLIGERIRMADAFDAIELSKAGLLRNSLLQEHVFLQTLPTAVRQKWMDMRAGFYAAWKRYRETNNTAGQDAFLELRESYLKYSRSIKEKYGFNSIRQNGRVHNNDPVLTRHQGAVVNYFLGDTKLYLYVHQNGQQQFIRKDTLTGFQSDLVFVRKSGLASLAKDSVQNRERLKRMMKQWYRWLLGGIGTSGELVVIPHKELCQVSFDMLDCSADSQNTVYLVEKLPVRYALSASVLHLSVPAAGIKDAEAFGGFAATNFRLPVDVSSRSGVLTEESRGSLQSLTGTEKEVREIAKRCGGDTFMHAKPDDFIRNAFRYKVLHIATHALSNQGPNHECTLIFETDSAGRYMVRDIQIDSLQLHAQMAVLSACNTGTGRLHKSEGMLSLGRSFLIAGCPSVVMSLWTVNDISTSAIMSSFYQNLRQGQTKSEALRNAQLHYIETAAGQKRKHPYYWAGFIIVGDNSPISFEGHHTNWVLWGTGCILGICILAGASIMLKKRAAASITGYPVLC